MTRPPVNKPAELSVHDFLTRQGRDRLVSRIDRRVETYTQELLQAAVAYALDALTARQAQPAPARSRNRTR